MFDRWPVPMLIILGELALLASVLTVVAGYPSHNGSGDGCENSV